MIRKMIFILLVCFCCGRIYGQQNDLSGLIQKIDERSKSYKEYHDYSANAVTISKEMDRDWNPQKVTTITKRIDQKDSSRTETVILAVENHKGKETDITEKVRRESQKQQEKAKKVQNEKGKSKDENKNQTFAVGFKELYPFSAEERAHFEITQKPDTVLFGIPVLNIQTRAKERNGTLYEGNYFIDSKTLDILRIDVGPAKNPKFVKTMRIRMDFEILPGNVWMFKSFWMRVFAGILIKKFRFEIEETYSDFVITR